MSITAIYTSDYEGAMVIHSYCTTDKFGFTYHLPVRVSKNVVTVWTAPKHCRYYTHDTLPDFMKQRLAMVAASGAAPFTAVIKDDMDLEEKQHEALRSSAYYSSLKECPKEFTSIGWRVNNKYFYIVVSEEELETMAMEHAEWSAP
jgi:hypothetical protein